MFRIKFLNFSITAVIIVVATFVVGNIDVNAQTTPSSVNNNAPSTVGPNAPSTVGQNAQNNVITVGADPAANAGGITLFDPVDKSIEEIFRSILDIIMVFAVPIILFFIVWAGFLYVTAGGSQDKITKATKALTYAIIGGVLVLGANVLLAVITNTIKAVV